MCGAVLATIPGDPAEFYLHPVPLAAILTGLGIVVVALALVRSAKLRARFKKFFPVYRAIVLFPVYLAAGVVYLGTLGRVHLVRKFKEVHFQDQWDFLHLNAPACYEDMRLHPGKYHVWPAVVVCVVLSFWGQFFIQLVPEKFYHGQMSIVFGLLSPAAPPITNFWIRWLWMAGTGVFVWIPSKLLIDRVARRVTKANLSDEPPDRVWYDKVRLIYIAWGYVIAADAVWALGLFLAWWFPTWEGLYVAWVCVIICGLVEQFYQFYNVRGLYKLSWPVTIVLWGLSMIPAAGCILLVQDLLPRALFA